MASNEPAEKVYTIVDILSMIEGSRFAITFLDYAKRNLAIPDEIMIDKITGLLYYKDKNGDIQSIGGDRLPPDLDDRLITLEEGHLQLIRETKEYTDSVLARASIGNAYKTIRFEYTLHAEEDDTYVFKIPLATFVKDEDILLVSSNAILPSPSNEKLGYTVDDDRNITFKTPFKEGAEIYLLIIKNVPSSEFYDFDGSLLLANSVAEDKLSESVIEKINTLAIDVSRTVPPTFQNNRMWFELLDGGE